jgi:hypothetical protein
MDRQGAGQMKWKKAEYKIKLHLYYSKKTEGDNLRTVSGKTWKNFGIQNQQGIYVLTHLNTGRQLAESSDEIKLKRFAKMLAFRRRIIKRKYYHWDFDKIKDCNNAEAKKRYHVVLKKHGLKYPRMRI